MGHDMVLKAIRKESRIFMIFGSILFLPTLILAIVFFAESGYEVGGICCLVAAAIGGFLLFCGIRLIRHPEKHGIFKINPYILQMADELYAGIKYDDGFIIMSDRMIAAKKDVFSVNPLNEVFMIYIYKQSTNMIPTAKVIIFACARGNFSVNVYGRKKETIMNIIRVAASCSPNARVGYTPENQLYLENARQQWDQMYGKK